MNKFNLDLAAKHVKVIADSNRCRSCDQFDGLRVRYPCGHCVCDKCVVSSGDCLLCLSPPDVSAHVNDDPLSARVEHSSNLLHTFQDLFNLDVYKRQRLSEQLKIEKEVFPECIQAPRKYCNRQSSNISIKNKENKKPKLPGENISMLNVSKMENTINYVQQWMNKNEKSLNESTHNLPRKPFTDINVNGQNVTNTKTPKKTTKRNSVSNRNRAHFKLFDNDKNKSNLSLKRRQKDLENNLRKDTKSKQKKSEKDESGIVIDDDDVMIINDSLSECEDKDQQAYLAVLEAEKNLCISNLSKNEATCKRALDPCFDVTSKNEITLQKIPFYKKGSFLNNVKTSYENISEDKASEEKNKNVLITIDNNSFVTTIKFSHCDNKTAMKHSVDVQTDSKTDVKYESDNIFKSNDCNSLNQKDVIFREIKVLPTKDVEKINYEIHKDSALKKPKKQSSEPIKSKCLIIEDSDTDSDLFSEKDSLLEVTADVHRSETENDPRVLSQLEQSEYEHRKRYAIRGNTPASTDSSDKENYDPNRAKRPRLVKKCKKY